MAKTSRQAHFNLGMAGSKPQFYMETSAKQAFAPERL